MNFEFRPMKPKEQKFAYKPSRKDHHAGSIGYLRGDFGNNGDEFWTTWTDHCRDLNTADFRNEFDDIINALRSPSYGLLSNRNAMGEFVKQYPDSAMKGHCTTEYGFRINTGKYSYLLRCNLTKGDYNFYCFCYQKESLEQLDAQLPEKCFAIEPASGLVVKITRRQAGYEALGVRPMGEAKPLGAAPLNEVIGVTKAQSAAMWWGSQNGWDDPAAKPENYDADGDYVGDPDDP